ncbi:hypothetical protein QYF36_022951 [Acer negundo]|nr:hypothetical protein QYF36_022951 [Acer negundo]
MDDVFMFSAQSVLCKEATDKEKPPDIVASAKRGRETVVDDDNSIRNSYGESFKLKLLSHVNLGCWSGFGTENASLKIGEGDVTVVTVRAIMDLGCRCHIEGMEGLIWGRLLVAKKSRLLARSGKVSSDTRQGNGSPSHGAETSRKVMGIGKKATIAFGMIYSWKAIYHIRDVINMGGSRFVVLAKDGDEALTRRKALSISSQLPKPLKYLVLVEISNRKGSRKKHVPFTTSKHRASINKGKHISSEMEEDLEDLDVLKILHKDSLDSVVVGNIAPFLSLDGSISSLGEGEISCIYLGIGLVGPLPPRLVDVSNAKDLDVVVSNLHEAMEVALK